MNGCFFQHFNRVTAKSELVFVLTQENAFSYRFHVKLTKRAKKNSLEIFKIALRQRDRHVFFFVEMSGNLEHFL